MTSSSTSLMRRRFLAGLLTVPAMARPVFAGTLAIASEDGFAVSGYDPVAYFTVGAPVVGKDAHRLIWRGAIWRFSGAGNMAAFERDPFAYAPQYGGFCALTLAQGALAKSTPNAWAIYDRKLYLTVSISARDTWAKAPSDYIARADALWPNVLCY